MARIGGFLKTQNRIRRHQAQGQFISPYQTGGTIFGKVTMARYPLLYTSSRLPPPPPLEDGKWDHLFGKSERMRYPLMRTSSQLDH